MKKLRLSNFGLGAFAGETLTPRIVTDFASAFATYLDSGKIVVGYDTRDSSPMVYAATIAGLLNAGCEVIDLGVCPTPMIQFAIGHYQADGGLSITGGHREAGWNSLMMLNGDGGVFDPLSGQNVMDIFHSRYFTKRDWQGMGSCTSSNSFVEAYFKRLESFVNVKAIKSANLTVLADPLGGAGVPYLNTFAQKLGLKLIPINGSMSGYLAREAEPRPRSAMQMAATIPFVHGNAGFLFSSDMVRMSLVTESSEPKSEECTFALIVDHILSKGIGTTVVTNCCSSRLIDDIVARHNGTLIKTKVGESHILNALADEDGVIGGEGNGSIVIPKWGPAFDGFLAMAMILESMAENKATLSELIERFPTRYHIVKKIVPCTSVSGYRALNEIESMWNAQGQTAIDHLDGLRIDSENSWIHVRNSSTEPALRIISEATDRQTAINAAEELTRFIEKLV